MTEYLINTRRRHIAGSMVAPRSIASAVLSGVSGQYQYTGQPVTPAVTVTLDGEELVANRDYLVSYADNTALGLATVAVSGIGRYYGEVSKGFYIVPQTEGTVGGFVDANSHKATRRASDWTQAARILAAHKDGAQSVIVGGGYVNDRFLALLEWPLDGSGEFHIAANSGGISQKEGSGLGITNAKSSPWLHVMAMSGDGTRVVIAPNNNQYYSLRQGVLSTPWDTSTVTLDANEAAGTTDNLATGNGGNLNDFPLQGALLSSQKYAFTERGNALLIATYVGGVVNNSRTVRFLRFPLSTPYDISTLDVANHTDSFCPTDGGWSQDYAFAMAVSSDGTGMIMYHRGEFRLYSMGAPFDFSSLATLRRYTYSASNWPDFTSMLLLNGGRTLFCITANGYIHEFELHSS